MTWRQILILASCVLLAALDGYDVLSMALVAPAVTSAWHIGKGTLGLLLSSGLAGMAVGSILIAPLADTVGRKPLVLSALALMTAGSVLSAYAPSVVWLASARVLTGMGIGAMVALTTVLSAEFSNARRTVIAVAAVSTVGLPLGGVVGGFAGAAVLRTAGWPWVFLAGAAVSGVLLVLLAAFLPETPAFLSARRAGDTLARLNRSLLRLGHSPVLSLLPLIDRQRASYRGLFSPGLAGVTTRLIIIYVLIGIAIYYILQWLPQLVTDAGFPPAKGSFVMAIASTVGLVGGILAGLLAARFDTVKIAAMAFAGLALSMVAIGLTPPLFGGFLVAGAFFGLFFALTTGSFYALIAQSFPPLLRASGVGLVTGVGRIAGTLGPALAGWMFVQGHSRAQVSLMFAILPIIAALVALRGPSFGARDRR